MNRDLEIKRQHVQKILRDGVIAAAVKGGSPANDFSKTVLSLLEELEDTIISMENQEMEQRDRYN